MAALAILSLDSCSSSSKGPGGQITKVKYFHLIPTERVQVADRALQFERQHRLYGAVTAVEQRARGGQYYDILWKASDRTGPVTLKFEYRQANNGLKTQSQEQEIVDVKRNNWTSFAVIGDDYQVSGQVTAWKLTLKRGADILATQQSYLWE